jgi:phosphoesterase RecJ-like protein
MSKWSDFVAFVKGGQRFLVATHVRPDGDALGSQLALVEGLKSLGKSAQAVVASPIPPRYEFLNPNASRVQKFVWPSTEYENYDSAIIIDTGTWAQIGDFGEFLKARPKVRRFVIDHHLTQDDLGGERLVDTSAEAAGRLAREALEAIEVPLNRDMAMNLFMALATDTGWFRHSSTSEKTFQLAQELAAQGANANYLYDSLFEQSSLGRLRLLGRALERLKQDETGQISYTEVYLSDYPNTGGLPPDTEDLINYPRSITGTKIALVFIEQKEGCTKVSFRGRDGTDVGSLAEQFGGGGHRLAAGATVVGSLPEVREQVLAAARKSLGL